MLSRPKNPKPAIEAFGGVIRRQRKAKALTQTELAKRILREDGSPISTPYVHDIESGRYTPSADYLVQQFAKVLAIDEDYLYYLTGCLPPDLRHLDLTEQQVSEAMKTLRIKLQSPR